MLNFVFNACVVSGPAKAEARNNKDSQKYSLMEDKLKEIIETLNKLELRLEKLEREMAALKGEEDLPESSDYQPIDLGLDLNEADVSGYADNIPSQVIPSHNKIEEENIPVQVVPPHKEENIEEDLPAPEDTAGLFGAEDSEASAENKAKRKYKALHEGNFAKGKVIMDVMADKASWIRDIPGTEVKSLRSAIALGDQVVFIRRLFREDSALYQDTIEKLNSMTDLKTAVEYLSKTFPEWDMESEDVYRFMMAVRRKIR